MLLWELWLIVCFLLEGGFVWFGLDFGWRGSRLGFSCGFFFVL